MTALKTTPIAIFTFDRADHVQRLFESLMANERLDECDVVIYCDGVRSESQRAGVVASRAVVREWAGRLHARVVEQPVNKGLAKSIVAGVTELCRDYGRVIVLEDDLVISSDFLDFMLTGLDRYQDDLKVLQVSGHMFPVNRKASTDAVFLPYSTTWGWATWDRAWRIFNWEEPAAIKRLQDPAVRRLFDLNDAYPFSRMLDVRLAGENESWGILWYWAVFNEGGLVLHPRVSLVRNEGFDGTGTHCGVNHYYKEPARSSFDRRRLGDPIKFPERVECDDEALKRIRILLRRRQEGSQIQSVRLRIRRSLLLAPLRQLFQCVKVLLPLRSFRRRERNEQ